MADRHETEIPVEAEAGYYRAARRRIVRIEQQPAYRDDPWPALERRWVDGSHPDPAPLLADWLQLLDEIRANEVTIDRVRITSDPPTQNQRYMQWLTGPNIEHGERFRYMTRTTANTCGLQPALGSRDWWLFDDSTLMYFDFAADGRWTRTTVTDDPERIAAASALWEIAWANSTPAPDWATVDVH